MKSPTREFSTLNSLETETGAHADSFATKTLREIDLIGHGFAGLGTAAEASLYEHPGETLGKLALSFGIGLAMSRLAPECGLIGLLGRSGGAAMGLSFALDILGNANKVQGALSDNWHSKTNWGRNVKTMQASVGQFGIDTALMTLGGVAAGEFTLRAPEIGARLTDSFTRLNQKLDDLGQLGARALGLTEQTYAYGFEAAGSVADDNVQAGSVGPGSGFSQLIAERRAFRPGTPVLKGRLPGTDRGAPAGSAETRLAQGSMRQQRLEEQQEPHWWQEKLKSWHTLSQKDKLALLGDLSKAPDKERADIFLQAMLDPGLENPEKSERHNNASRWKVREVADSKFFSLEPRDKVRAWKAMLDSDDYFVRLVAIARIGELPAELRYSAFTEVLKHSQALSPPRAPEGKRQHYLYGTYKPPSPTWWKGRLSPIWDKSAANLLVESIACLPSGQRLDAWNQAFSFQRSVIRFAGGRKPTVDRPVQSAATGNLSVLPLGDREAKWHELWESKRRQADSLVSQIAHLPSCARAGAIHAVFASHVELTGEAVSKAIGSLSEPERLPAWRKLYVRSSPEWMYQRAQYDRDYLTDCLMSNIRQNVDWKRYGRFIDAKRKSTLYHSPYSDDFYLSTESLNRGLGQAIEALPEKHRVRAWIDTAQLAGDRYLIELAKVIPSLPEKAQLPAVRWALKSLNTKAKNLSSPYVGIVRSSALSTWHQQRINKQLSNGKSEVLTLFQALSPRHWPKLVEAIMSLPEATLRSDLLMGFPITECNEKDLDNQVSTLHNVFSAAFQHARIEDYRAIAKWWTFIHEPEPPDVHMENYPTPVKDRLLELIPPHQLGRLLVYRTDVTALDDFSVNHPDLIKALFKGWDGFLFFGEGLAEEERLAKVGKSWNQDNKLASAVNQILEPLDIKPDEFGDVSEPDPALLLALTRELALRSSAQQREEALSVLKGKLFQTPSSADKPLSPTVPKNPEQQLSVALAVQIGKADPAQFERHYLQSLKDKVADRDQDYSWRLSTTRQLVELQRKGDLDKTAFTPPDLRMSKLPLPRAERDHLRAAYSNALFDGNAIQQLWGDGLLGKLFPQHFGHYQSDGGIVGRPQHGGHQFSVDEHTLLVMQRVREHPLFETLSRKDKEDLLSAAMMHDAAKRANMDDPDHEWAGANLSWGIYGTMGYSPVRIKRIANLIGRHCDLSYSMTAEKLQEPETVDDIATFYRLPTALTQLRILNESDIRSINQHSSHWTPEAESRLDQSTMVIQNRAQELSTNLVPILTSELPSEFGLVTMNRPYALLAHVSDHLNDSFLNQLSLIESSFHSMSTSLITTDHQKFYYNGQPTFALVACHWEHISQAYRENLSTGTSIDWQRHIELSKHWTERAEAKAFAGEIDRQARKLRIKPSNKVLGHLDAARRQFAQYDSLDELIQDRGVDDPYVRLQQAIYRAFTTDDTGKPLAGHNEIKVNNPCVVGLGVLRGGKSVFFENMNASDLQTLLNGHRPPRWLSNTESSPEATADSIVIPETTWRSLLDRHLPIVVLDP